MVSAQAIVNAARLLNGVVKYRQWQPGDSIPMWLDDGINGVPEPPYLSQHGVMSADLINFALIKNGLPPGGGTESFADYLVNTADFDPSSPGQAGAVALRPYEGPDLTQQGHIALYLGEHQIIQSIPSEGVIDHYTDEETYAWASEGYPQYGFTIYGFLPGVSY